MTNADHAPLFDFVAAQIAGFLQAYPEATARSGTHPGSHSDGGRQGHQGRLRLGFTFSFTVEQTSLEGGTLIRWDKGWDIPSAVGRDPCALLQAALDRAGLAVEVSALANDSVGTLLTRCYTAARNTGSKTLAGLIIGTGTNAAYVERLGAVTRLPMAAAAAAEDKRVQDADGDGDDNGGQYMIMNTEWGCFDDTVAVLPCNPYDDELDRESIDPGSQRMEKRVGGMYLGELFRLAVLRLHGAGGVLDMTFSDGSPLFDREGIDCEFLSFLAGDHAPEAARHETATVLAATHVSNRDVEVLQRVAGAVARRAGRIVGAALAALLVQTGNVTLGETEEEVSVPEGVSPLGSGEMLLTHDLTPTTLTTDPKEKEQANRTTPSKTPRTCLDGPRGLWISLADYLSRKLAVMSGKPSPSHSPKSSQPTTTTTTPTTTNSSTSPPSPPSSLSNPGESHRQDQANKATTRRNHPLPILDIGVDGSVIEFHPTFEADMRSAVRDVPEIGPAGEQRIRIGLVRDGSAVGAALMAQAAIARPAIM
jgi:hexokinase